MKAGIKKLRTCAFTKAVAPSGFLRQSSQLTNKVTCDHSEMKTDWTENKCEPCTFYLNRNITPEPPVPSAPTPEPPPLPTPAPEPEAAPLKKTRARNPKDTSK